jgi:radical SAM-linked protein
MRLRITFAKTDAMRFTSHLDLHPRINLASALPLGFTGEAEVVDIWLDQTLPVLQIASDLVRAAPPGIKIGEIQELDDHAPTLQTVLEASEFVVTFLDELDGLDAQLDALLAAGSLPRQKRGKDYDLRPLVLDLRRLPDDEAGCQRLLVRLSARPNATGRPEEVISALGAQPEAARVHRTRLIFVE